MKAGYQISKPISSVLDWGRGIASFLVVVSHARSIAITNMAQALRDHIDLGWGDKFLFSFTTMGHDAVVIFFVISGYLVGGTTIRQIGNGDFNSLNYAVKRISRIYSVLLPALLVGGALDLFGVSFLNDSGIYSGRFQLSSCLYDSTSRISLTAFAGNSLALQSFLVPTFGTNGPLWSIANESWYYVLGPFVLLSVSHSTGFRVRMVSTLAVIMGIACLPFRMSLYGLIWLFGAAITLFPKRLNLSIGKSSMVMLGIGTAGHALAVSGILRHEVASFLGDALVGVGFSFVLVSAHSLHTWITRPRLEQAGKLLASFSFSLYVTHYPMMFLLAAATRKTVGIGVAMPPTFVAWSYTLAMVALSYLWAYFFYNLFERRISSVRAYMFSILT